MDIWDMCDHDEEIVSLLRQNGIFTPEELTEVNLKELTDFVGCADSANKIKKRLCQQEIYLRDSDAAKQQKEFSGVRKPRAKQRA